MCMFRDERVRGLSFQHFTEVAQEVLRLLPMHGCLDEVLSTLNSLATILPNA